jgi:hypothetical protein
MALLLSPQLVNHPYQTPMKFPDFLVKNFIPTVWLFTKTNNLTIKQFSWFAEKGQALELAV